MASSSASETFPAAAPRAKGGNSILFAVLVILLLQSVAGVWFWHKSASRAALPAAAQDARPATPIGDTVQPVQRGAACARPQYPEKELAKVAMEPFLVNLSGSGAEEYLRASVTLSVHKDPKAKEEAEAKDAGVTKYAPARDTILGVLSRQDAAALLASGGKAKLKSDILEALTAEHPELSVVDVYFTDFLVQS